MPNHCENCKLKDKEFLVMKTQLQFQIKKLNQDMACQKITLEIGHQKESKKLMQKICFTKKQYQQQSKSWMEKYDVMISQYQNKLQREKRQHEDIIRKLKNEMSLAQESNNQQISAKLCQEITLIKQENQDYKNKLLISKAEEKKYIIKIHEEELKKTTDKHKIQTQELIIEKQKLEQIISNFEITENKYKMSIYELTQQIERRKRETQLLNNRILLLENKIKLCFEPEIGYRQKQLLNIRNQHERQIAKLKSQFEIEKNKITSNMNKKIEQLLKQQHQNCNRYENKLKELDQKRQKQIQFYKKCIQDLKNISQQKFIPKAQFHQEISTLKVRLNSKEKDIEKAKQQIKQCRLQIQNNDEMLSKFFRTSNHNTAPDIFAHTPNKKKDYKIKKSRVSMSGVNFLQATKQTNFPSMEHLDNTKNFQSFRIL